MASNVRHSSQMVVNKSSKVGWVPLFVISFAILGSIVPVVLNVLGITKGDLGLATAIAIPITCLLAVFCVIIKLERSRKMFEALQAAYPKAKGIIFHAEIKAVEFMEKVTKFTNNVSELMEEKGTPSFESRYRATMELLKNDKNFDTLVYEMNKINLQNALLAPVWFWGDNQLGVEYCI